jgi:hypothetical protein
MSSELRHRIVARHRLRTLHAEGEYAPATFDDVCALLVQDIMDQTTKQLVTCRIRTIDARSPASSTRANPCMRYAATSCTRTRARSALASSRNRPSKPGV